MAEVGLGRRVGNLLLALLNATLILTALCLWFAWSALSAAERVSQQISTAAETVLPMRAEIAGLTEEIAAARADLAGRGADGMMRADTSALEVRIAGVEAQLADLTTAVRAVAANPEALIDQAVTSTFDGLGETVAEMIARFRSTTGAP